MFNFNHWLNRFPGTNFHELNIDWLVEAVKELAGEIHDWEILNQITYQGTWDITKNYPSWSIVIVGGNDGYISLKPVPSGINYTNTEYWAYVADFSAIIAGLGNRVADLEKDVTKLNYLNDGWSNHKFLYVGDSYGRGRTYPGTYGQSWCDGVTSRLQPAAAYNMCVSQSAFFTGATYMFGQQLETFKNGHTTTECEEISDIIIAGGYNETFNPSADIVNDTGLYSAYWMNNYIKQYFPNARVHLAFIGRVPILGGSNATFYNFTVCIQKYKNLADKYGWHYVVGSENISHYYLDLTSDGIHWKTNGYLYMGYQLADAINNGCWIPPQTSGEQMTFTPFTSTSGNSVIITNPTNVAIFNQRTSDGINVFNQNAVRFEFDATSIDTTALINVCKYYDKATEQYNMIIPQYNKRIPCAYALYLNGSSVAVIHEGFMIFNEDGTLQLGNAAYEGQGTVTADLIYITAFNHTFSFTES